jgi:RecB family exonuclease
MTLRQTVLSSSQIGTFRRCALQWWLGTRCRIRVKPPAVLTKGKAVHAAIAAAYEAKMGDPATPVPQDLVTQTAADAWDLHAPYTQFEDDEKPGELKDRTVALARLHHKEILPKVDPVMVEEELRFEIAPGIQMLGYVDCVDTDGVIHDAKVSGRSPDQNGIQVDFQLASYTLGVEAQGIPVRGISLDHLVDLKTPRVEQVALDRATIDTRRAQTVAQSVAHAMATNQIFPTDDMKTCSWCALRKICHGQPWWRYVQEPVSAMDAARTIMPEQLLPPDAPR